VGVKWTEPGGITCPEPSYDFCIFAPLCKYCSTLTPRSNWPARPPALPTAVVAGNEKLQKRVCYHGHCLPTIGLRSCYKLPRVNFQKTGYELTLRVKVCLRLSAQLHQICRNIFFGAKMYLVKFVRKTNTVLPHELTP
jgi:hypothetical protein